MNHSRLAPNPPSVQRRLAASASLTLQSGLHMHDNSSSSSNIGERGSQSISSAQFQRQLLGGTSLSLALPRARQPKQPSKRDPPPSNQQRQALGTSLSSNEMKSNASSALSVSISGRGWTCAVCGSSNPWHRSGHSNGNGRRLGVNSNGRSNSSARTSCSSSSSSSSSSSNSGAGNSSDDVCEVCSQRALASSLEELVAQHENTANSSSWRRSNNETTLPAPPSTNNEDHMEINGRPALSNAQWAALEDAAADRQLTSEAEPCPICLEDFTLQDIGGQVITSCSHLFHATCLHSFEAFQSASHGNQGNINHHSSNTRTSSRSSSSNHGMGGDLDQWVAALAAADYSAAATAASSSLLSSSSSSSSRTGAQQQQQPPPRACPTCRTPSYQRRATAVGGLSHRRSCATKLQALARGVLQRKRYAVVVRQWIGGGGGDEARRRKYVSQELETLSTKLLAGAVGGDSIDALFAQSDAALQFSQGVFQRASPPQPGDSSSSSSDSASSSSSSEQQRSTHGRSGASNPSTSRNSINTAHALKNNKHRSLGTTERQWAWALASAESRGDRECAICMSSLDVVTDSRRRLLKAAKESNRSSTTSSAAKGRNAVLLSCSHVFHSACVSAFERFALNKPSNMAARSQHYSTPLAGTTHNRSSNSNSNRNGSSSTNTTMASPRAEETAASTRADDEFVCPMCRAPYDRRPLMAAPSSSSAGGDLFAFADLDDVIITNMHGDDDDEEDGSAVENADLNEGASDSGNEAEELEEGAGVRRYGHAL